MKSSKPDTTPCRCDDCGEVTPASQLDIIKDIEERLSPGSIVPAGQCPHCAALAYYAEGYAPLGSAQDGLERIGATSSVLKRAEAFVSGFEDDETQEGVSGLLEAIRAAIAGSPWDELQFIRNAVRTYDDTINDKANDGANARPPTGDDYNEITYLVLMGASADPVRKAACDTLTALRQSAKAIALLQAIGNATTEAEVHDIVVNASDIMDDLPSIASAITKAEGRANG